jgi:hypothetical protein
VLATFCAFEMRYDLPVVFVPTVRAGARLVERWAFYFARQTVETINDVWRAKSIIISCKEIGTSVRTFYPK